MAEGTRWLQTFYFYSHSQRLKKIKKINHVKFERHRPPFSCVHPFCLKLLFVWCATHAQVKQRRQNKTPKQKKKRWKEKKRWKDILQSSRGSSIQIRKHKWANPLLLLIGHHTFISTLMQGSLKLRTFETNGQKEKET